MARYRPSGLKATADNKVLVRDPDKLLAGRGLDDPGGLVLASGREIPAVGAEGDGVNSALMRDPESSLPVVVSTTRAVLSSLPVARYRPSGLKATAETASSCVTRMPSLPVVVSTTRAVLSAASGRQIPAVGAEGNGSEQSPHA